MGGKFAQKLEILFTEPVRIELMRRNTNSCGILTFAILLHLSLVLDQGKHLGENHHKLVIPAVSMKVTAGERHPGKAPDAEGKELQVDQSADVVPQMDRGWTVMIVTPGMDQLAHGVYRSGHESSPAAISRELPREFA